jgi:predicted DNA binding CopG/RHH family protein
MRGIRKDKNIQIRFSEAEIKKYKQIAIENGLTLSGFTRYSMAKAARLIKTNNDEVV